ncbi:MULTISPECIES: hypothetical protein [unclassified Pseudomonas]|uniref:hypothetical protein n=1 Tax=unclassified Pseudomonas TaxID=196821 RepID=UPI00131C436D|nr:MULTISPECIES: hypothetical protein [unclassified Pseudomonas]
MAGQIQVLRERPQVVSLRPGARQHLVVRPERQALAIVAPDPGSAVVVPTVAPLPIAYDLQQLPPVPSAQPLELAPGGNQVASPRHGAFVLTHGQRGAQGRQGAIGPSGGSAVTRTAGVALSALYAVYERGGQVFPLDPTNPGQALLLLGITTTAAAAGGSVDVQRLGTIDDDGWTWSEGLVFVGPGGRLTQEAPATGWEIVLGSAPAPTRLNLDIDEPLWL